MGFPGEEHNRTSISEIDPPPWYSHGGTLATVRAESDSVVRKESYLRRDVGSGVQGCGV